MAEDRLTNVISDSLSLRGLRGAKTFLSGQGRKETQNLPEGQRQTGGGVGERSIILVNMYIVLFTCQVLPWVFYINFYLIPPS